MGDRTVSIGQVLAFRDADNEKLFGTAMASAFVETQRFYTPDSAMAALPTYRSGGQSLTVSAEYSVYALSHDHAHSWPRSAMVQEVEPPPKMWDSSSEGFYHKADVLGSIIAQTVPDAALVIVTDVELEPPEDLRYIIWGGFVSGAVVSIPPTDPTYWGDRFEDEKQRIGIVKTRVRAACLSIMGMLLGLQRCENPRCYLYRTVDSVTCLDDMREIGPEHAVLALQGRIFAPATTGALFWRESNPNAVERITELRDRS